MPPADTPEPSAPIDDLPGLETALAALEPLDTLCVDTEFVRVDTYYPRLCLLQAATADGPVAIDALAGIDLAPVWALLASPERETVMHAARQDLELMRLATGMLPARLFDTQVAAALLGHQPQIGYAGAVEAVLGEKLDKAHARADWTRRPLPADQLAYALEDVVHLPALATRLREDLIAGGRLDWALEDSARLLEPGLYDNPPEDAWQRIKGFGRLRGAERAAAATLAAWREREAVERDRPRQWILSDAVLLATAVARPTDVRALRAVAGMPGGLVRRAGDALLHALEAPPPEAAMRAPAGPPSDEEKSRLAALAKALGKAADALGIETSVLATRADMMDVIRGRRRGKLFEGWRREAVGPTVERYLPEEVATAIESAVER